MSASAPPPHRTERIGALDVARGIAILGTLGTNIWIFTDPDGLLGFLGSGSGGPGSAQAWLLVLTQGKFLALLSLMFGMGVAVQHRSAVRRGVRWPGPYLWRAFLLLVDGAVNYVLIAEFDVLMGYAITGAIVAGLMLTSPRARWRVTAVLGAIHIALISLISVVLVVFPLDDEDLAVTGESPYATASFRELALFRIDNWPTFRAEPVLIACLTTALFLIGARLLASGVFTAEGSVLRRRLLLIGGLALPVDIGLGVFGGLPGMLAQRYLAAPLVALGLLALIAEVCLRTGAEGWQARRLREVGRTALSCYLLQNLLAGSLFYGWGLGLATHPLVQEHRVLATVLAYLAICAVLLALAHLWLRRFRLGPVEWVWKRAGALVPDRSASRG